MAKLASTIVYGELRVISDIESIASIKANAFFKADGTAVSYVGHTHAASEISSGTLSTARLPSASTSAAGIVQLNNTVTSTSAAQAATANAVKTAYDLANGKADASHTHSYAALSHTHAATDISSGTVAAARLPSASTSAAGIVQLSSATNSTSTTLAATASAVKAAWDLANGKANASHTHSYLPLTGGTLSGNLTVGDTIASSQTSGTSGGISLYSGTSSVTTYGLAFRTTASQGTHGNVTSDWATYFFMSGSNNRGWIFKHAGTAVASISGNGYLYATRVYNAYYNDYAEYFKKDEDIEYHYIVQKNTSGDGYIKSQCEYSNLVIGVSSNSYGHLLGGEGKETDKDHYIEIGVAGRVKVYISGPIEQGDLITSSSLPGIGMKAKYYRPGTIVGKALEAKKDNNIGLVEMMIMLA